MQGRRPDPCKETLEPLDLEKPHAGAAPASLLEGLLAEGGISPREKEAALQMKRLHRGIGTTLQARTAPSLAAALPPALS